VISKYIELFKEEKKENPAAQFNLVEVERIWEAYRSLLVDQA